MHKQGCLLRLQCVSEKGSEILGGNDAFMSFVGLRTLPVGLDRGLIGACVGEKRTIDHDGFRRNPKRSIFL